MKNFEIPCKNKILNFEKAGAQKQTFCIWEGRVLR